MFQSGQPGIPFKATSFLNWNIRPNISKCYLKIRIEINK